VGSAMGLMKAAKRAPDAILLPTDFERYGLYSRRFKDAVRTIAPKVQDRGIDEIYIDLTGVMLPEHDPEADDDPWWRARDVARALKDVVREATGLSCSIAVAPNKLLAKIASELDKPDGLTIVREADVPLRIWPLPVKRINGIGPKAAAKLEAMGLGTIGELAQADRAQLVLHFGPHYGAWLLDAANGRDDRPVETESEPKSMSRETTFDRDLHARRDRDELSQIFTALCEDVADDLKRHHYVGRTIGIKLRYDDFKTVTRDQTIDEPTQDAKTIRHTAGLCLKRVPLERRIRLLGVRVGSLSPLIPVARARVE
jgi:DNA polymerase IV